MILWLISLSLSWKYQNSEVYSQKAFMLLYFYNSWKLFWNQSIIPPLCSCFLKWQHSLTYNLYSAILSISIKFLASIQNVLKQFFNEIGIWVCLLLMVFYWRVVAILRGVASRSLAPTQTSIVKVACQLGDQKSESGNW